MATRGRLLHRVVPDSESDEDERLVTDSLPIDLSDEEVINATSPPRVQIPQQVPEARHPVEVVLSNRGVRPRTDWLESCLNELAITHPGFAGLSVARQAELCFGQFLMVDFNVAGAASLPSAMHSLHGTELPGPFVLQVDEVTDISHSLRDRYQEKHAGSGRTLKLSMTDGVQRVTGLEYRPIKALQVFSPAGLKISLKNVFVKRGLLMLVPEVLEILGGSVEHLESARLQAVQVINKPPRGRRTRQGSVEPALADMATRAAWPAPSEGSLASVDNSRGTQQRMSQTVSNNAPGTRPSITAREPGTHQFVRGDEEQEADGRNVQHNQPVESTGQSTMSSRFQHSSRATFVQQGAEIDNVQLDQPAQAGGQSVLATEFQHCVGSASVQRGGQQQPMQQEQFTNSSGQSFRISGVRSLGLGSRQQAGHLQSLEQRQEVRCNLTSNFNAPGVVSSRPGDMHQSEEYELVQQVNVTEVRMETIPHRVHESTPIQASAESNGQIRSTPTFGRPESQSRRLKQTKLSMKPQVVEQPLQAAGSVGAADVSTPMDLDDSQESGQNPAAVSSSPPLTVDNLRDRTPFSYLSVLKDRTNAQLDQTSVVRGKVKVLKVYKMFISIDANDGFYTLDALTVLFEAYSRLRVITFQYKDGDEFKLHIYIEDGSLITPASVQHQLVQRLVGYSPQEVISGLKDPRTHRDMHDNMIRFQTLLERYEGLLEVEFSAAQSVPTVLQMTEGVQLADVRLLCDRVHQSRSKRKPGTSIAIPVIDLSTP